MKYQSLIPARSLAATILSIAALAPLSHGAITISSTAPTVDGADISQPLTQFNKSLNTGGSLGQSITTGNNTGGYSLNSFTMLSTRELLDLVGTTFTVRISVLDTVATTGTAGYESIASTQTGFTYTGDLAVGDFMTFDLTPVTLVANTIYGIEIDVVGNGTGTSFAGQFSSRGSTNAYADGNFYIPQATFSNDPLPGAVALNSEDLTFYTDIAAVPEPSTALLGGLGMLVLLRRRRIA